MTPDQHSPLRRNLVRLALPAAAVAALVTACGGGGQSSGGSGSSSAAAPASSSASGEHPEKAETIKDARAGKLGPILVDESGRAVYLFEKDHGNTSSCYGACAKAWPPVTTNGKPKAAGKAMAPLLGTTSRKDGQKQVTYHGHPLYYYAPDDHQAGSVKGQDVKQFGAEWYALSPQGTKVEKKQAGGS